MYCGSRIRQRREEKLEPGCRPGWHSVRVRRLLRTISGVVETQITQWNSRDGGGKLFNRVDGCFDVVVGCENAGAQPDAASGTAGLQCFMNQWSTV